MNIQQRPAFKKAMKKLHKNQKADLKEAIEKIIKDPAIGTAKKGDLKDVRVYKFKMAKQESLLAYMVDDVNKTIIFEAIGTHEKFYRDLKGR